MSHTKRSIWQRLFGRRRVTLDPKALADMQEAMGALQAAQALFLELQGPATAAVVPRVSASAMGDHVALEVPTRAGMVTVRMSVDSAKRLADKLRRLAQQLEVN